MGEEADRTYDAVTRELLLDEDYDVDFTPDGLLVHGRLFAFLDEDDLIVELPEARSVDLRGRGIAEPFSGVHGGPSRNWVRVVRPPALVGARPGGAHLRGRAAGRAPVVGSRQARYARCARY